MWHKSRLCIRKKKHIWMTWNIWSAWPEKCSDQNDRCSVSGFHMFQQFYTIMHAHRTLSVAGRKEKQGKNVIYYPPNICNFQGTAQCDAQCLDLTCKRTKSAFLQKVQKGHFLKGDGWLASSLIIYLHWVDLGLKSTRENRFLCIVLQKKRERKNLNIYFFW